MPASRVRNRSGSVEGLETSRTARLLGVCERPIALVTGNCWPRGAGTGRRHHPARSASRAPTLRAAPVRGRGARDGPRRAASILIRRGARRKYQKGQHAKYCASVPAAGIWPKSKRDTRLHSGQRTSMLNILLRLKQCLRPVATRTPERYRVKVAPAHWRGKARPFASGFGPHLTSCYLQPAIGSSGR